MKRLLILLPVILLISSCENTWDSEARDLWIQGCMNSARDNNIPEDKAKEMCQCRLEKVMEKHPNFAEAMENIQDVINDPAMKECEPDLSDTMN